MTLTVVILAAGQGKRMKSGLPKVLHPLAGRPLLAHVIATARSLEPAAIQVVIGHGGDQVRQALEHEPVSWVWQTERLGTGHAVQQAMPAVPDDHTVLVLYGDVPLTRRETLAKLLALAGNDRVALLTTRLDEPTGYGRIIRDAQGRVLRIVEQKDATEQELQVREVNTGILAAPAGPLKKWLARLKNDNAQGEYYLTDIIAMAVENGIRVEPLIAPQAIEALGVNDKVQLAELEAAYRREVARELMLSGVTIADPARIDIRGSVTCGTDVFLDVNVVLEGTVRLGNRVRIGPNCMIRDTEIADGTEIHANCVIERAVIGPSCVVGPFARIRPGTTLEEDVHIGNFVEVKNSRIAPHSKANHLTYLGDAVIGSRVNVGAGTVTCNYDGANKWQTHIGDGAFIGSGSMLVAPVRIGAGATIGAGSTINRDAPEGKLTVARARQVTIDNWQRPTKKK